MPGSGECTAVHLRPCKKIDDKIHTRLPLMIFLNGSRLCIFENWR